MLTGWVCLYLFLVYVLTHGGKIQGWHAGVWIVATFVGTFLVVSGRREVEGGRKAVVGSQWSVVGRRCVVAGILTGIGLLLPILFSWILSHYTDFSWDGMTSRGITVRNLMKGDPAINA